MKEGGGRGGREKGVPGCRSKLAEMEGMGSSGTERK